MYIYLDEKGYVYGCGSEYEENSFEVPFIPEEVDAFLGCYKYENGEYILDENRKAYILQIQDYEKELVSLQDWFKWYDEQCIQYQRAQRLGTSFNRSIEELDKQAVENAKRITEIRTAMNTPYTEQGGEENE